MSSFFLFGHPHADWVRPVLALRRAQLTLALLVQPLNQRPQLIVIGASNTCFCHLVYFVLRKRRSALANFYGPWQQPLLNSQVALSSSKAKTLEGGLNADHC